VIEPVERTEYPVSEDKEEKFGHDRPFAVYFTASDVPMPSLTNTKIDEIVLQWEPGKIG